MTVTFEVVDDPARGCAALMIGAATGGGDIVLAGGSTPRAAHVHFVEAVRAVGLDLSTTTFWIGDERCVDPADDRSNYKMIKESLLDPLAELTELKIHRIKGELGPDAAAADYERTLRDAGPPIFDLVMLGLGPDGHTASLFPGQQTLAERSRLVVGVPEAGLEPFVPRVSLTVNALAGGRHVVFLAEGASKADAVARAFGPGAEPDPATPASLVAPEAKRVTVLIDGAAASHLPSGDRR